ncbi:unnamed protein product [Rotaria sordida]|uniref:Uncharacterized protein n=1 Tax=Rotaria sordida TaxID=392033 RepID=A0A814LR04_9BILA|nr:unnamed protein product [Rotaria sordida]
MVLVVFDKAEATCGKAGKAPKGGKGKNATAPVGAVVLAGKAGKAPKGGKGKNATAPVGAVVLSGKPRKGKKETKSTKTSKVKGKSSVVKAVGAGGEVVEAPKQTKAIQTPGIVADAVPKTRDGLYVVQSLPSNGLSNTDSVPKVATNQPSSAVPKTVEPLVATGKEKKRKSKISIPKLIRKSGQSQGKKVIKLPRTGKMIVLGERFGVSDLESNRIRDITIDSMRQNYLTTDIDLRQLSLLYSLLRGHVFKGRLSSRKSESSGCAPQDVYVNYVYEHDIHNQVFNSSFQDPDSFVIQSLQSDIARYTAEELYKRNLVSDVKDKAHLIRIMDVSKQYKDLATLRFYVSIIVRESSIPIISDVFKVVFTKLQNERFAASNKKIDWGQMMLLPITK